MALLTKHLTKDGKDLNHTFQYPPGILYQHFRHRYPCPMTSSYKGEYASSPRTKFFLALTFATKDSVLHSWLSYYSFTGSHTVILVPSPSLDRISKCPQCLSTIHLAMESPRPEPPVLLFRAVSDR